ncbi:putative transposase element [Trichinella sp. T9]|nr:putative transposase element [Trichinella sp. T9]
MKILNLKGQQISSTKTTNALNKDRILKSVRENTQVTYKVRPIRITPDLSAETMKARRSWTDVIQTLREHKCQPRLIYTSKNLNYNRWRNQRIP